jgi:hypothetical protein
MSQSLSMQPSAATKEHIQGGAKIRPPEPGWRELPPNRRCRWWQKAFLNAYLITANLATAARAAGIARRRHYHWLEQDADYRRAFDETREELFDDLWDRAVEWALVGMPEPLFYQGKPTGVVIYRRSEKLLILLLQILMPEKYGPVTCRRTRG